MRSPRLIERWLPIAELGIESTRERTPMTPYPAPNRLHVWWARRPLVASRAAVLASLLPEDADRKRFLQVLGIHGDPVAAKTSMEQARRAGIRVPNPYDYERAFKHSPSATDRAWVAENAGGVGQSLEFLDPTAGGGSIPFEARRLGLSTLANDLNPVAALVMKATVEWPASFSLEIGEEFDGIAERWRQAVERRLSEFFVQAGRPDRMDMTYLWARTVVCPYCEGVVPLSPNWRLATGGVGVRVVPHAAGGPGSEGRVCSFEVVESAPGQSAGTVARGAGVCPFPDCRRVIEGDEIKAQARTGGMGEQLYAVVFKERVRTETKTGKTRWKWVRRYRAPRPEDDNGAEVAARLAEKFPEWEALDIVPGERFPETGNDDRPIQYGMPFWRDLFSPRQLLGHGTAVEVFREMLEADRDAGKLDELRQAAYGYLALSLDKLLNYNSRMTRWHGNREVLAGAFDRHDFAFVWSYGEMAPLVAGIGYDWAIRQTAKCIGELAALSGASGGGANGGLFEEGARETAPPITITCKPGDALDHAADASVDLVVMDPPYYDNVMYAELSDFFYVWLKRTAGHVFPDLFRRRLTDKENEAVANPARFRGEKGAKALAGRDYQERMAAIFAECRRVLRADGLMTVMFTHKATGAWDALTTGLIEAGFAITASWPIRTEASGSLHIRDRAAANSTIFLVCRPRASEDSSDPSAPLPAGEPPPAYGGKGVGAEAPSRGLPTEVFWEDVEPTVAAAVRGRMDEYQKAGIAGVDLYLAAFGPALEEFSTHWPLRRGQPRARPIRLRGARCQSPFEEERDPYAATPEDALEVARREVKRWRLKQLTDMKTDEDIDPPTAFFVLAWDAFRAPAFPYDEALGLARTAGVDLEESIVGRMAEKKGSNLQLWDSGRRAAAGSLGPPDGSRGMIDSLHHAAHRVRQRNLEEAKLLLETAGLAAEPRFSSALKALLEVLPVPKAFTGVELRDAAAASGSDFEALEKLRRFAFRDRAAKPRQLLIPWGRETN